MDMFTKPSMRAAARYFLLQVPGLAFVAVILFLVRRWVDFPAYIAWLVLVLWIAKDIALFPFLWRYYDADMHPDPFRMVGRKGVALTRLHPDGHVQVHGERWRASVAGEAVVVEKGAAIRVVGADGLRLTVSPCGEEC